MTLFIDVDSCNYGVYKVVSSLLNLNTTIKGELPCKKTKLVIMSNHYTILDLYALSHLNLNFCPVTKMGLVDTKETFISEFAPKKTFYELFKCIMYDRGNIDSGTLAKKEILDKISNKENVLVFPDGRCYKDGHPGEFKNGIFRLCAEHNIKILPITIRYTKDIGIDKNTIFHLFEIFDQTCTIYIHDICQNTNYIELKQSVYDKIASPYNLK